MPRHPSRAPRQARHVLEDLGELAGPIKGPTSLPRAGNERMSITPGILFGYKPGLNVPAGSWTVIVKIRKNHNDFNALQLSLS